MVEKYNAAIKDNIVNFNKEWALYSHFFPRCILAICRFLRLMWLLSIRPLTSFFFFVRTFCLCICIYWIVTMCTGHYPVPSCAVDMTGIEPCKEVESVSECIVNGWMHAVWIKAPQRKKKKKERRKKERKKEKKLYPTTVAGRKNMLIYFSIVWIANVETRQQVWSPARAWMNDRRLGGLGHWNVDRGHGRGRAVKAKCLLISVSKHGA